MIPIIMEKDLKSRIEPLEKKKYIANKSYTLFQFLETVKKKFAGRIKKSESISFYIAGRVIESGGKNDSTQRSSWMTSTTPTRTRMASCTSPTAPSRPFDPPF